MDTATQLSEIGKRFNQIAVDLRRIVILYGIDQFDNPSGFCIRSCAPHGPMPEILIRDTGDSYPVLYAVQRETAKLCAIVRIRMISPPCFEDASFCYQLPQGMGHWCDCGFEAELYWQRTEQIGRLTVSW